MTSTAGTDLEMQVRPRNAEIHDLHKFTYVNSMTTTPSP